MNQIWTIMTNQTQLTKVEPRRTYSLRSRELYRQLRLDSQPPIGRLHRPGPLRTTAKHNLQPRRVTGRTRTRLDASDGSYGPAGQS